MPWRMGNVSLFLQTLGVRPTTVDISPEMLAIYERKATALGLAPAIEVAEIDAFLLDDSRSWDLIVFSSALHHLEDYAGTLELAAARLAPGGAIVTIFDPTAAGLLDRRLRRLEYVLHVLVRTPWRVPALVRRRIVPSGAVGSVDRTLGERAERHALAGIDDARVHRLFERLGLDVRVHERTYEARFGITRALYRLLRRTSSFHFIAVHAAAPVLEALQQALPRHKPRFVFRLDGRALEQEE